MYRSGSSTPRGRRPTSVAAVLLTGLGLGVGAVLAWFVVPAAPAAGAHAALESTRPADDELLDRPPRQVTIAFTERVEVTRGGIDVLSPSGASVADTTELAGASSTELTVPVSATRTGTYTVVYRVVSADGHPVAGSFVFHVGERSSGERSGAGSGAGAQARTDRSGRVFGLVGWLGRWCAYSGLLMTVGLLVGRASLGDGARTEVDTRLIGRRGATTFAGLTAAIGSVLILVARVSSVSGAPIVTALGDLGSLVGTSRTLRLDVTHVVLAVTGTMLCRALPRALPHASRGVAALAAFTAVATLATFAFGGHAATSSPAWLAIAVDLVHLVSAGAWMGGIALVLIVARAPSAASDTGRVHREAARFSRFAIAIFPVVLVTGVGSSLFHVSTLRLLATTTYGRLLVAKVLGVVLIGTLAWINRRLLARMADRGAQLLATLTMERDVALAVVGVTAVLVFSVPAVGGDSSGTGSFSSTRTVGASAVRLVVEPALVGDNSIEAEFTTASGRPRSVDVAVFEIATASVPGRRVPVDLGNGTVATAGRVSFGVAGRWTVVVRTVSDGTSETATFEVEIR